MTELEKIEKWARGNKYICRYSRSKKYITRLSKVDKTYWIDQYIILYDNTPHHSYIVCKYKHTYKERNEIDDLYIPLNNVKRDEKLLREYLENEK